MEPVFTLSYSEFCVAEQLLEYFSAKNGYSIYVPLSRQEKGVDLILSHRSKNRSRTITIQVKASRIYSPKGKIEKSDKNFNFYNWFNNFEVPNEADFIFLVSVFPPDLVQKSRIFSSWWSQVIMVFSNSEMKSFIDSVKTKIGKKDRMFGFGFNDEKKIVQTRGDMHRRFKDFSKHLLKNKIDDLKKAFDNFVF